MCDQQKNSAPHGEGGGERDTHRARWRWFGLVLLVMMSLLAGGGCAAYDEAAAERGEFGAPLRPDAYERGEVMAQAEEGLIRHDLRDARDAYDEAIAQDDPFVIGAASAGRGLVGMALLGESKGAKRVLLEGLGATRANYDVQRLVWANNGILYWLHEGARWEDDGFFQGIKSIVADQLPWPVTRLESVGSFVQGLDDEVGDSRDAMLSLASELEQIEADLDRAINDPKFEYFYVPAALFHDGALSFAVGKSELSALRGMSAMARGAITFVMAYESRWSLERAFGGVNSAEGELDAMYLDPLLFRALAQEGLLRDSRRAWQDGFDFLAQAITLGLAQEEFSELSVLRWDRVDRDQVRRVRDLLSALSHALDGPTELPHFSEEVTLDLSTLFAGRTLSEELPWFVREESTSQWTLSEDAIVAFLGPQLLSPPLVAGESYPAQLEIDGEAFDTMTQALLGQTIDRVSLAFGL